MILLAFKFACFFLFRSSTNADRFAGPIFYNASSKKKYKKQNKAGLYLAYTINYVPSTFGKVQLADIILGIIKAVAL